MTAIKAREIVVALDPIDAIYIVSALAEMEKRWRGKDVRYVVSAVTLAPAFDGRADRCRRVREAIETAVYGSVA